MKSMNPQASVPYHGPPIFREIVKAAYEKLLQTLPFSSMFLFVCFVSLPVALAVLQLILLSVDQASPKPRDLLPLTPEHWD